MQNCTELCFIIGFVPLALQDSVPEPQNPPMEPVLREARERGRHFVQCLLRPNEIRLYTPDANVKAELRPYQQVGYSCVGLFS